MREQRFPTRQACPTTLSTTPVHSKTLIPPKDSNPHAKNHTPAPNPLRHAPIPLPGTLHNPNHFPHCPHKQQKTPHPSGIEPASEKHTQNHLTDCARPGKRLCENFIDTFFVPAKKPDLLLQSESKFIHFEARYDKSPPGLCRKKGRFLQNFDGS